jgi:hypothetical protein
VRGYIWKFKGDKLSESQKEKYYRNRDDVEKGLAMRSLEEKVQEIRGN